VAGAQFGQDLVRGPAGSVWPVVEYEDPFVVPSGFSGVIDDQDTVETAVELDSGVGW